MGRYKLAEELMSYTIKYLKNAFHTKTKRNLGENSQGRVMVIETEMIFNFFHKVLCKNWPKMS